MSRRLTMTSTRKQPAYRYRSSRGAALVEYAFIFILFMSLLFGISGFGHALYVYHALNHAAKEGARWAAVNGHLCNDDLTCNGTNGMNSGEASIAQIQTHVQNTLAASINQSQAVITAAFTAPAGSPQVCTIAVKDKTGANYGPYSNYPGCTVTVQVQYTYTMMFPLINIPPINMSSTAEMVIVH